ncbi:hypothetical protein TPY_3764 [Sulfobacillus acidophilus TPY]|uniref:DUF975 domain-containing protein n=1 Tax=Sulfobacillus acidophilus (strain ATCC 700253 / DSM 10332 / NAL) TaxID=679936 RepID=G8TUD6_SULAD|nr:hypothetical protein TPY_3764 [Sulfobacillus acidophilus TPY]AEW06898.1 hypothetical protein Sulac_3460 [Sulfobacillus acidophilus DSM 10332]
MSQFGLIRNAWQELWQRNRTGGILTLAFWYTMITSLYQYLVASRLGPELPSGLRHMLTHPSGLTTFPHLTSALWIKLGLVYLTFLLVVLPFTLAGLYGGVADTMRDRQRVNGFLAFFRYAALHFWKAITQFVLTVIGMILVFMVFSLLMTLTATSSGGVGIFLTVILLIIFLVLVLSLVAVVLLWFGSTFYGEVPPLEGLGRVVRWVVGHWPFAWSSMVLLVGLALAYAGVGLVLSSIPVIGPFVGVVMLGMIFPAFIAVYAMTFYQAAQQR